MLEYITLPSGERKIDRRAINKQSTLEELNEHFCDMVKDQSLLFDLYSEGRDQITMLSTDVKALREDVKPIISILRDMEGMSRMMNRIYSFIRKMAVFLTFMIPIAMFWDLIKEWFKKLFFGEL